MRRLPTATGGGMTPDQLRAKFARVRLVVEVRVLVAA